MNYYDSECTLLYFIVENYLLNEQGTDLVTKEQEEKLLKVIEDAVHHYQEVDKSLRAKNAYDVLFKGLVKRNGISDKIKKRQQILGHVLVMRVVNVLKGYHNLLEEKRGAGSDLEGECRFLLKRIGQLETGSGTFSEEREWIKQHVGSAPKEESLMWKSSRAIILVSTPLLLTLIPLANE